MKLLWCVLVFAGTCVIAQHATGILGLYEGDDCPLPNGVQGVCRRLQHCPAELNRLHGVTRYAIRRNPVICSFLNSRPNAPAVVCCPKIGATNGRTPKGPTNLAMLTEQLGPTDNQANRRPVVSEFERLTDPAVGRRPGFTVGRPFDPTVGRHPGSTVGRPPGSTVSRPFDPTVGRPPGSTVGRFPDSTVGRHPGSTVGRPPGSTVSRLPDSTVGRLPGSTVGRLPGSTVGRPEAHSASMVLGSRLDSMGMKSRKACEDLTNEISPEIIPLINGGTNTLRGEFPHMALIGYRSVDNNAVLWNCGGALISRRYVLTAAHCILVRARDSGPAFKVRLGEYDLRRTNDGEEDYNIEKSTPHPAYKANTWDHDIALIKLNVDVAFSTFIRPACLYTDTEDPKNGLIITGWGVTSSQGDKMSNVLQKGIHTLDLVPASTCETRYFEQGARNRLLQGIHEGMFCAVDQAGMSDTCKGDSGGPIQIEKDLGHTIIHEIVGVTAVGPSLCGGSTPAIYTRVYNYLGWIENIVWPS